MGRHRLKTRGRGQKFAAIAAALTVIGLGAVTTLASWTDSEWVFGGLNGDPDLPGVGTSMFNVEQNTDPDIEPNQWADEDTNPGGGLSFSPGALALTPGDSIYAPVALRAAAGSVDGTVLLQKAVAAAGVTVSDQDHALWEAVQQRVAASETPFTCDSDAFSGSPTVIASGALGTAQEAGSGQSLPAGATDNDPGAPQYYCFELTLPSGSPDTLQGRTIAPAWEFAATSG